MTNKTLIIIMFACIFGFVAGVFATRFFYIDTCLDRGGAWDYERKMCVRYIPREQE